MTPVTTPTGKLRRRPGRSRPHWSYSQLNQYMRCPLQYFFERILKLPRSFVPSGLVFGSAIHEALAEYHRNLQNNLAIRPESIRERFLLSWQDREDVGPIQFGKSETRDDLVDKGAAILDRYLEEPPPANIVAVEEEMMVPLYNSRGELLHKPLIAIVDLLCRDEDGLAVVEFKTSKRKYGEAELETALQATTYIHAIQERHGEPVSLHYCVLVKTKTPQIQRLTTDRTQQDIGRLGDTRRHVFLPTSRALRSRPHNRGRSWS